MTLRPNLDPMVLATGASLKSLASPAPAAEAPSPAPRTLSDAGDFGDDFREEGHGLSVFGWSGSPGGTG